MQRALSELVQKRQLSLTDLIRIWRDESDHDHRPNKALQHDWLAVLLRGYLYRDDILAIVNHGIDHPFRSHVPSTHVPVENHKSARVLHNALTGSLRKGQDDTTYLVVNIDTARSWPEVRYSPFGCIPKAGVDPRVEARAIHDLSHGATTSTNAATQQDALPPVRFRPVQRLAERIESLRERFQSSSVKIMKGDVKSAFRHIPIAASSAQWFAGTLPKQDAAIIDLALPFGWSGSPAIYGIFGGAITHLVSRESPATIDPTSTDHEPFFGYEWVDDHVMIEVDSDTRLATGEAALRLAMLAVLGPRSINASKFTSWSTSLTVLGLQWDTERCTVSMPEEKIAKAILRIDEVLRQRRATKHQLSKLLGSLRHVCSCIRPAKPFYQRVVALWRTARPFVRVRLTDGALLDLMWFRHVLDVGRLRSIPTSYFGSLPTPGVHLYMDASDRGLCVLHPAERQYIRVQFDSLEAELIKHCRHHHQPSSSGFSINVREQLGAVLAVLIWGISWSRHAAHNVVHVRCWVDNVSAVSWCNSLSSTNIYSQELNRILGAVEAQFAIRISAQHIAGARNTLADLGSRAWEGPNLTRWTNAVREWYEQVVPTAIRRIYDGTSSPFSRNPSPHHHDERTSRRGGSGVLTDAAEACQYGCLPTTPTNNPYSWLRSPFTAPAKFDPMESSSPMIPFDPESAMSAGIIAFASDDDHDSTTATNSLSQVSVASSHRADSNLENQSRFSSSSGLPPSPTSPSHTTACSLGLRCWAFSSYYARQST